jgi:hypothetical protein
MTSTSSRLSNLLISGFGFLLLADPTHLQTPPTHPQPPSSNEHLAIAGLGTGWLPASRCHRKENA